MKLLIVEAEDRGATFLRKGMTESGFAVDVATTGEMALTFLRQRTYDIALIEVAIPVRNGMTVLATIRNEDIQTPVILLSVLDDVEQRVRGLDLGADDYLVKPVAFSEILARVRSVLRRSEGRTTDVLTVGELKMDMAGHRASRAGQRLDLTPKEFALLSLMARRPGEVLTRTLISEKVWDMNLDTSTNVVDVHIRRLRSKVDDPFKEKIIRTIRGVGYMLEKPD